MLGNYDPEELGALLDGAPWGTHDEGKVIWADDEHEMISCGYSNVTPWHTYREQDEAHLRASIDAMVPMLEHPERAVFNLHAPPFGTQLDEAPMLDANLQVQATLGQARMVAVGSTAVRDAEQTYQPLLGLHGHIHELSGIRPIGRTVVLNPGSDYSTGAPTARCSPSTATRSRHSSWCAGRSGCPPPAPEGMRSCPWTWVLPGARDRIRHDGRHASEIRRPYPTFTPHDGWAEQDATRWRSSSLAALGALVKQIGTRHSIRAIGLTGQCPSVVPIDGRGMPLRPGLIYRDNRAVAEAMALCESFGAEQLHVLTGHVPAAFHVAAKILWIRGHEPDVFNATRLFLQPTEFLALTLTGDAVTDWSMAAASALLDLRARRWAPELVEAVGLDLVQLPVPSPSWSVVGELLPSLVRRFGLPQTVPVVAGAGDSIACALGAGVTSPGPVSEMAGSSTCLNTVVSEPAADLAITHYPSAVGPDGYVTEVGINTAGEAVDWLASLTYGGRSGRLGADDFELLDREAREVPAGSDGLLFVPVPRRWRAR